MHVNGQPCRTIWFDAALQCVQVIDQTRLPHHFEIVSLHTLDDACHAIVSMQIRGAPLIGVTAAFGVALALREGGSGPCCCLCASAEHSPHRRQFALGAGPRAVAPDAAGTPWPGLRLRWRSPKRSPMKMPPPAVPLATMACGCWKTSGQRSDVPTRQRLA
jgi:hypothetical protein